MATRQMRMIDEGRAALSPGIIILFRPSPSFTIPLLDLEARVYAHALAAQHGREIIGEEACRVMAVDDMHLTSETGEPVGSHPEMWAEIWRTADCES